MIFRANSHRAYQRLKMWNPDTKSFYNSKTFMTDTSKGYYFVEDNHPNMEKILKIQGLTKARSQKMEDYSLCWNFE